MNKKEHIEYWKISADKSLNVSWHLFEKSDYVESVFFAHLMLEKLLKAHWVKDNTEDFPPKIHNLINLVGKTKLTLGGDELDFLRQMNDFQLQGRYPDYRLNIYKTLDEQKTKLVLDEAESIYQWLLNELP